MERALKDPHGIAEVVVPAKPKNIPRPSDLQRGETHRDAILTNAQARDVKRLIAQGMRNKDIVTTLGIKKSMVESIKYGITWKHITLDEETS